MATINELNALNIRPRTMFYAYIYDQTGTDLILTITSNELIRATVSLRSDLSRIDPTLPESEIEIEAYFENDISDQLAAYGDKLQVWYWWYPATASYNTVRHFYTDERITWSEKILHIHAVDQVHLLDEELPPIYMGQDWYWNHGTISDRQVLHGLSLAFRDFIRGTKDTNTGQMQYFANDEISNGIMYNMDGQFTTIPDGGALNILVPRMTRRQAIAKMMNLCRWEFDSGQMFSNSTFWLTYVDAGRPTIKAFRGSAYQTIKYEDCGNFKESKEPIINSITATVNDVQWLGAGEMDDTYDSNMTSRIIKQQGISFDYKGFGDHYNVGAEDPDVPLVMYYFYVRPYSDDNKARKRPPTDYSSTGTNNQKALRNQYGKWLLDENVGTNAWSPSPNDYSYLDLSGSKWNEPLNPAVPTETPASLWSYWESVDIIPEDAESTDAINSATFFVTTDEKDYTIPNIGPGENLTIQDEVFLSGHAIMEPYNHIGRKKLLPDMGLQRIMQTSNVVGSFTWKGDPRLQPRDYVNLEYPDENLAEENGVLLQTENGEDILVNQSRVITIENITLTHEGGGTICDITYRQGYC